MSVRIPAQLEPLLVDIDSVVQHPDNPNNGDTDVIVESIATHGFVAPIRVQASTRYIVAGNHRYAAMLALGQTQIPALVEDITDEQAKRFLIVDNRTAELAKRDEAQLAKILESFMDSEAGLLGTGYTPEEYTFLLAELEPNEGLFGGNPGTPVTIRGVMVECDDEDVQNEVVSILEGHPGVKTRRITL